MRTARAFAMLFALAAVLAQGSALATPVGTAFTYQGVIEKNGQGINGACSIKFTLYDALTGGSQIGSPNPNTVSVTADKGRFTTTLDFGALAFNGNNARWLEIAVQAQGDQSYTILTPRQPVNPAPYAIYALNAPAGGLTLPFAGAVSAPSGNAVQVENTGASGTSIHGVGQFMGGSFQATAQGSIGVGGWGAHQGVFGTGTDEGIYGETDTGFGVRGYYGTFNFIPNGTKAGVYGHTVASNAGSAGARGEASIGYGVHGISSSGIGVYGATTSGWGVHGTSNGATKAGVYGQSTAANGSGVLGRAEANSVEARGVFGYAPSGGVGVAGISEGNDGMVAVSNAAGHSGIWAYTTNANGYGGAFNNLGGGVALLVTGVAQVSTLQILGSDLAESFPASHEGLEPGTVLEIVGDAEGTLRECRTEYSPRVAGVVSGANGVPAGVILEGHTYDKQGKVSVGMSGRVWVKCDATRAPIQVGDLLTTSSRAGHAMKASDPSRATGAILGKAMTSLEAGTGWVLVLVSLQ